MAMSKDRVQFQIKSNEVKFAWQRFLLQKHFGVESENLNALLHYKTSAISITCRPSQFGRWIVERNIAIQDENCGSNNIVELRAKLVQPVNKTYPSVLEHDASCIKAPGIKAPGN